MVNIPQLERKIGAFLCREDGKIRKDKLIKIGMLAAVIALGSIDSVQANCPASTTAGHTDHCNDISTKITDPAEVVGKHNHAVHGSHSSY